MYSSVFWVITRCKVVCNRRLGTPYWSLLQESKCPIFLDIFILEDGDQKVVPKPRFQTTLRHIITQKTEEFSSIAAEACDLARAYLCHAGSH